MNSSITFLRIVGAWLFAVIVATVLGSIVQTQFNLAALAGIGVDISAGLRVSTTFSDIFSGFTPTYGIYVVAPALLVAFAIAWFVVPLLPGSRMLWFTLAGGLAIGAGIPLVNYLAPVALLIGATRDVVCLVLMALAGAVAGMEFARIIDPPAPSHRRVHSTPAM